MDGLQLFGSAIVGASNVLCSCRQMVAGADSWTPINLLLVLQFVPKMATAIGYRLTLGSRVNL